MKTFTTDELPKKEGGIHAEPDRVRVFKKCLRSELSQVFGTGRNTNNMERGT